MSQFTQLGLSGKPEGKPEKKVDNRSQRHPRFAGEQTVAVFAGALIFTGLIGGLLLETSGCSRSENKAAIQAPPVQSVQPTFKVEAVAPAPVAVTPTPKKVVKKRPTTVAYEDPASGVSFRYPRKYVLKPADSTKPDTASQAFDMNFVQAGGVEIASVELPKGSHPGTDLAAASFNVSINKNLTSEQCSEFTLLQLASSDDLAVQPTRMKLAGMDVQEMEAISGTDTKQADAKYYHYFENGVCYEFALGLSMQAPATDEVIVPVDREEVFRSLERILATVKINQVAPTTPEVAVTPAISAPASQDVASK